MTSLLSIRSAVYMLSLFTIMAAGCGERNTRNSAAIENQTSSGYVAITTVDCDETGFNGKWKLVNIKTDGKSYPPPKGEEIEIKNCTEAAYYSQSKLTHTDKFRMYRVVQYCADYQLIYNQDSLSCINFMRDTLIIGTCNNYETTRYYYKKISKKK
jgi:hypothetical protein